MERHAMTHSGHKPYRCNFEDCSFASARESSLKNHILKLLIRSKLLLLAKISFESVQNSPPIESRMSSSVPIPKHSCTICEFKTRKLKKYDAHIQYHRKRGYLFCHMCDFVTLKQERFKKHMNAHETTTGCEHNSSKKKSVTPETVTSQNHSSSNSNPSLPEETLKSVTKFLTVTQTAESAMKKDPPKHKRLKVNHHFDNSPEFMQESKKQPNIQPSPQLEPLARKTYLKHNQGIKNKLSKAAKETEEKSYFKPTEGISSTIAESSLEYIDSTNSVLQVKIEQCKKYSCPVCDFGTKRKKKYVDHIKSHQKEGHLLCSLCNFASLKEELFKKHLRAHKNHLNETNNSILNNGLISEEQLTSPYTSLDLNVPPLSSNSLFLPRSNSEEVTAEDSVAEQLSEDDNTLPKWDENGNLNGEKSFTCSVCEFKTQYKRSLTRHVKIHTGDKPFSCTYSGCNYSSARKGNLMSHLVLIHSNEKPFSCQLCGEAFKTKHLLNSHVINHRGRRPHQCLFINCEYSCTTAAILKLHMRSHTKEKPYHCYFEGCGYSCSMSWHLKSHIRTHTGERPYPCNFKGCNKSFRVLHHLKSHIVTHTGAKPFRCDFQNCKFSYTHSSYLKVHMLRHLTQNQHTCPNSKRSCTPPEIEHPETHYKLQNTALIGGHSEPTVALPIGENPAAEDISNVLRVQTLLSFSSQNNNERDSKFQYTARPCKKYVCAHCAFESKSKKQYEAHLDSHEQNSTNATSEVSFTGQTFLNSEHSSQTRKTAKVIKKSAKVTKSPDKATTMNLRKRKTMKTKHHFEKQNTEMQPSLLLKPHATKSSVNFSRNKNPNLTKPGTQKEESSAEVDVTETNSPTNAQPCVVNIDLPQSVSQVKANPWRMYCCPNCEFGTKKKPKYKDHVELHEEEGYLFCSLCDFSVLNSIRFKKHLRTHENGPFDDNNSEIQRSSCSKVPPMRQETLSDTSSLFLNSHSLILGDEVSFDESVGAMHLPDYGTKLPSLKKKETSNEQNCFKCSACDYKTQHKHHLPDHARIHTGDRPFSCTYSGCNYSATQKRSITAHCRVHTKVKPYHCDFNDCKFSCAQPGHLKGHMQRHLTQNPHSCPKCKFRSRTLLEIEQHLETFHKLQDASNSDHSQPNASMRESSAEAIANNLRVQAQLSFSSQNNNNSETYSETRDEVRPTKKHACARCDFESKSHKKYKAHLDSHVEERQSLETKDTKLAKRKSNSKQRSEISSNRSEGKENGTALLLETKKSLASFPCNFCQKSFAKEMKLFNHLRYHTGQKTPAL